MTSGIRGKATKQAKRSLDPFDKLPFELISDILTLSQNLYSNEWRHLFPITPLLCCKRWHSVALDTGELWRNIRISGPRTAATAAHLAPRAKGLLLFIIIEYDSSDSYIPVSNEPTIRISKIVLQWIHQCQSLSLRTNRLALFKDMLSELLLRRLPPNFNLVIMGTRAISGPRPGVPVIQSTSIKSLHLINVSVDWGDWKVSGLEDLKLIECMGPLYDRDVRSILALNPLLRVLHLSTEVRQWLRPLHEPKPKPVMLHHLLEVLVSTTDPNPQLSQLFEAPSLLKLAIGKRTSLVAVMQGLGAQLSSVEYLLLDRLGMNQAELVACGRTFPCVRHLGFGDLMRLPDDGLPLSQAFPHAESWTVFSQPMKTIKKLAVECPSLRVVNVHVHALGFNFSRRTRQFSAHAESLAWLRERFQVNLFGAFRLWDESQPIYRGFGDFFGDRRINLNMNIVDERDLWTTHLSRTESGAGFPWLP